MRTKIFLLLLSLTLSTILLSQDQATPIDTLTVSLDLEDIQQKLKGAPAYQSANKNAENKIATKQISIPTLSGKSADFLVYETVIIEEPLYSQFPEVRSYILVGKDDPAHRGRLSTGPGHVNIMTKHNGNYEFIEPYKNKPTYKLYKGNPKKENMTCGVDELDHKLHNHTPNKSAQATISNGVNTRTYRIAIATTGEFYQANGNTNATVLAVINNYLNLLNDIFEAELAVTFNLIGNNSMIMFSDPATDGINPANSNTQLSTTQSVISSTIGSANYDIGHALYTIPGACCGTSGVASIGVICNDSFKARGWTGLRAGTSDDLFTGTFAHEIGHQFGAFHSFYGTDDSCNQRSPGHGYEPGSGNTIMSYEGTCLSHNITPEASTFYFHTHSIEQMVDEMNTTTCEVNTTALNAVPVTTTPANKTIPRDTPFELIGSASDADGDVIYYNWEQFDTDNLNLVFPSGNPEDANLSTTAPLFRSFDPSPSGNIRTFPTISDIANNSQTQGEILPSVARTMKFRLNARDFAVGGGAFSCDDVDITVDASIGPFNVTSQSTATTWTANGSNTATISWDVAGTSSLCSNVDILFSTDRGLTFPYTLVSSTTNDGSHVITIPSLPTSIGRIKVKCSDNYFFDMNLGDIEVISTCMANGATFSPDAAVSAPEGDASLNLSLSPNYDNVISFPLSGGIDGTETPTSSSNGVFECGTSNCTVFGGNTFYYDNFDIYASIAGTYTFSISSNFSAALQFFDGQFSVNAGCSNLLDISRCFNPPNVITNTVSDVTVTLTPGVMYSLAVSNFFFGAQTGTYTVSLVSSPAGAMLFDGPNSDPGSGFSYTYVVVDTSNDNVVGFEANGDLTSYAAGNYEVYGLSYDNTASLSSYIGGSFSTLQSDLILLTLCGNLSTNQLDVEITGSTNCPPNYAGANALTSTEFGTQDYETDGAIESTQIIEASATIDYDSGTSIQLDAPFEVKQGAVFNAFIDGCGGAMLKDNSKDNEEK